MGLNSIEIKIVEYKEDPRDYYTFVVVCDVNGPGTKSDSVNVYFAEEFVERYFRIRWHQDYYKQQKELFEKKRDFFINVAVIKIEEYIKSGRREDNIFVEYEEDMKWAKQIEKGIKKPVSSCVGQDKFSYLI